MAKGLPVYKHKPTCCNLGINFLVETLINMCNVLPNFIWLDLEFFHTITVANLKVWAFLPRLWRMRPNMTYGLLTTRFSLGWPQLSDVILCHACEWHRTTGSDAEQWSRSLLKWISIMPGRQVAPPPGCPWTCDWLVRDQPASAGESCCINVHSLTKGVSGDNNTRLNN